MRFKVDEDLPAEVATLLRSAGHEAETVHDEGMRGWTDQDIGKRCQAEGRALVTLDLGFADVRANPPEQNPGLMVLRVGRQDKPHVLAVLRSALSLLEQEPLEGKLWIVEEGRVRVRG
ncbi:MAG: DUF5615 family PIN-like protein [Myxococcales bacterium]|nr:DUF5615 family PIN-like protein [Myxococcales bacterium]